MKRYSLERKNAFVALTENLRNTLPSFGGMVFHGSMTGLCCAMINNPAFVISKDYIDVDSPLGIPTTFFFFCFAYYARKTYANFKKDKARIDALTSRMEQEETLGQGFQTPEQISRTRDMQEFDRGKKIVNFESYQSTEPTLENEKRKTLNLYS